jgi:hypothetical protein
MGVPGGHGTFCTAVVDGPVAVPRRAFCARGVGVPGGRGTFCTAVVDDPVAVRPCVPNIAAQPAARAPIRHSASRLRTI